MLDPEPYELVSVPKVFSQFLCFCDAVLEIRERSESDDDRVERTSE